METDRDIFKSLRDLTEFYIRSENTGKTIKYHNASSETAMYGPESDIMKNHNGAYVMRVFKSALLNMPKVLVWDGRV